MKPALILASLAILPAVLLPARASGAEPSPGADGRVFEMRTYLANEGKFDALHARFRDHTDAIFKKHGMSVVGYWVPMDEKDGKANTLVYLLAFPSRDAAKASWKAFQDDPEWQKARAESERDGKLVSKVTSVFMEPTDYSPIR